MVDEMEEYLRAIAGEPIAAHSTRTDKRRPAVAPEGRPRARRPRRGSTEGTLLLPPKPKPKMMLGLCRVTEVEVRVMLQSEGRHLGWVGGEDGVGQLRWQKAPPGIWDKRRVEPGKSEI